MISIENVSVAFEEKGLLENVNLEVRRGETFTVIGPSGLGKSVILKVMAGLIEPVRGRVLIDGKSLYQMSRREFDATLKRIGMLFQKNALFDSFTVGENLAFPLRETTSLGRKEIAKKVDEYLEYVQLSHAKDLFPHEISGGMQKRVGVARALILNPEIILYDDPTAGLDPITSKVIIELIISLNKKFGTTVVAITNDMNRAYQMANRIGMVVDKTLLVVGNVSETKASRDPRVKQFVNGELVGPLTGLEMAEAAT